MPESSAGLLFDLDGSLIDTAPDMGGALNQLLQQEGRAPLCAATIRPHVSHGSRALVQLGFGAELSADAEQALIARFLSTYLHRVADASKLFDGMDALLLRLEANHTPWGIITNKPTRYTVPLLQQLGLIDRCSALVCGDSLALRKPHPAPIELACRRAALQANLCIYVGDAQRDIAAGAAAGMQTVLMQWGYFDSDDNTDAWGADWSCADAMALQQICVNKGLLPDEQSGPSLPL